MGVPESSDLLLVDEAQPAVREDEDRERQAKAPRGEHLHGGHQQPAVAEEDHDGSLGCGQLRTDRGGQGKAHALQACRNEQPSRRQNGEVASRQHLVQTGVHDEHGLLGHGLAQGGKEGRRRQSRHAWLRARGLGRG